MPELSRTPIHSMTAHQMACRLLVDAGFILSNAAMRSESCYYYHPALGPAFLLRVSTHTTKKGPIGLSGFVSKATFTPRASHSEWHVHNTVAMAIGRYFMAATRPPSRYDGSPDQSSLNGEKT
jgi:hypothetical protein